MSMKQVQGVVIGKKQVYFDKSPMYAGEPVQMKIGSKDTSAPIWEKIGGLPKSDRRKVRKALYAMGERGVARDSCTTWDAVNGVNPQGVPFTAAFSAAPGRRHRRGRRQFRKHMEYVYANESHKMEI